MLDLAEEIFSIEAVAGMISDEIEASRRSGWDDEAGNEQGCGGSLPRNLAEAIVGLVRDTTGETVTVDDTARRDVPPEQRPLHEARVAQAALLLHRIAADGVAVDGVRRAAMADGAADLPAGAAGAPRPVGLRAPKTGSFSGSATVTWRIVPR